MEFYQYTLTEKDKEYCLSHAIKMADGFSTYSFKNGQSQSIDVYYIGKVGEFVFYKYLRGLEKQNLLKIKHVPFRANYDKLNFNDDFIIEVDGKLMQIEVRTKGRSVEPKLDYECCTDCIKPNFVYVFLSFNKTNDKVTLLGFANWNNLRTNARVVLKGSTNANFENKVNEFNIQVKFLHNIGSLINKPQSVE